MGLATIKWHAFDANKDGIISKTEFNDGILNNKDVFFRAMAISAFFDDGNRNTKEFLSLDDLSKVNARILMSDPKWVPVDWHQFDADNDGKITRGEFVKGV